MREGIYETAEDENWVKAEWYVVLNHFLGDQTSHHREGSNYTSDLE